jgi:hypothetical protein
MSPESLTIAFTVDNTPEEAYAAITNVRGWWSGTIDGSTDELGAEFTYRYQDVHRSTQRITELTPGKRVAWHVLDGYLAFVENKTEWTGTDITFDIAAKDAGTEVRFTHIGLVPDDECFDSCSTAWHFYVGTSLRNLITTGHGAPNPVEVLPTGGPGGDTSGGHVAGGADPPGAQEGGRGPGGYRRRLGAWVVDQARAVNGPGHETYLVSPRDTSDPAEWRTEIGQPIFQVAPS